MEDESDADARTIFCGNLSSKVTEEILYELFLQAGPVEKVKIPMTHGRQANYGFVTYTHVCSVDYALEVYKDTELHGCLLNLRKRKRAQQENNDRDANRNGHQKSEYNSALQCENNMVHMSNMYQNMMPQGYSSMYQNNMYQHNMFYPSSPQQMYDNRRSPPRSRHHSLPHNQNSSHTPSGRYDQNRPYRRYNDDIKSNNDSRRNYKRNKR